LLVLATTYRLAYRVLRCAKRCRAEVYILGDLGAQALALSRYCDKYIPSHRIISGAYDDDLAYEINCLARDLGIAMALPGDAASTRALIACRHLLHAPCFPLPDLELFDRLNDKWRFGQLCRELGIRHPATHLVADTDALDAEMAAGHIAYPAVLKPPSLSGAKESSSWTITRAPGRHSISNIVRCLCNLSSQAAVLSPELIVDPV